MNKIILKGHIVVPDSDLAAVKEELIVHIDLTRKEEGCLVFNVTQDETDNNKFYVYEEFINEVAFSNHQKRVRSSKWGLVTKNVERFYEITGLDK
ncbi:MAG: antibiotic biosynthesis monooxygenase [Chloroflexota bacterium]